MKGMIQIAYEYKGERKSRSVMAEIVGPLAVHRTHGQQDGWTVTHCKTGQAVHRFFHSRPDALNVAKALQDHPGWDETSVESIVSDVTLKDAVSDALRQVGVVLAQPSN